MFLLDEKAPPNKEIEAWILANKARFKEKYGKDYQKYLYAKAWAMYNQKNESSHSVKINKTDNGTEVIQQTTQSGFGDFQEIEILDELDLG